MKNYVYYYLHSNGDLIYKDAISVDNSDGPYDYFDSPFVKKWWQVKIDDINTIANFIKEAKHMGALPDKLEAAKSKLKQLHNNYSVTMKEQKFRRLIKKQIIKEYEKKLL